MNIEGRGRRQRDFWAVRAAEAFGTVTKEGSVDDYTQTAIGRGMEGLDMEGSRGGFTDSGCHRLGDRLCDGNEGRHGTFSTLVLGDAMVDVYYIGTATRLNPEAPIPVVKIDKTLRFPGGAANVAANLQSLGIRVSLRSGELFYGHGPITKNRLMVGDTQIARWDENDQCGPIDLRRIPNEGFDTIVVADYGKGSITPGVINAVQRLKWNVFIDKRTVINIFVDTKTDPTPWLTSALVMFPNEREYRQYSKVYDQFEWVVSKRGARGIALHRFSKVVYEAPSFARFVRSVNGAGDSVMAGFVFSYLNSQRYLTYTPKGETVHMIFATQYANAMAAVVVEKPYTATATNEEVEEVLRRVNEGR